MGVLVERGLCLSSLADVLPKGKGAGGALLLAMLFCVAGAMTAAAGELAALTVPLMHARLAGSVATLSLAMALSCRCVRVLPGLGRMLVPLLLLAWTLCAGLPREQAASVTAISWVQGIQGVAYAICYGAMNVMLDIGPLCQMGKLCGDGQRRRIAFICGLVLGGLLLCGNAVFLSRGAMVLDQPLPIVFLLRGYGKTGYYLSAALLYLAVLTTLIPLCQGINDLLMEWRGKNIRFLAGLLCFLLSLAGFGALVARVYPALGLISLILFLFAKKTGAQRARKG